MSVDILVGGREAVGALKLAPLADATGGVILLLEDFGESFFENLSAAVRRPVSDGAIFTVRASAGVGCARVIGAVEALSRAAATMATAPSLPSGDSAAPAEDAADAFRMKSRDISQVRHPICSASSVRSVSTPSQEPGALMCAHGPRVGRRLTSKHNQPATSLFLGGIGPNCVDTSRCVSPQGVDTSSLPQIATGFELNFRATLTLRFTESRVWSSPLAHGFMKNATSETTRPILTSTRTINKTPGTDNRLFTKHRRASQCSWSTPGTSRRVMFTFSLWLGFHHPRVAASLGA